MARGARSASSERRPSVSDSPSFGLSQPAAIHAEPGQMIGKFCSADAIPSPRLHTGPSLGCNAADRAGAATSDGERRDQHPAAEIRDLRLLWHADQFRNGPWRRGASMAHACPPRSWTVSARASGGFAWTRSLAPGNPSSKWSITRWSAVAGPGRSRSTRPTPQAIDDEIPSWNPHPDVPAGLAKVAREIPSSSSRIR